ncbi:hypothetical protein C8N40_109191 [Pontibacter mucosus]|uniref:Uncharacterized protein n=1 Tax=Pontibacter mucosus TaxID=1649266 RepID=A0A2T5YEF4_9BACT|nr:hypothetical protein [Pontibacter mucosus]PTX15093.1 hypothetical protein C8N40_109191 [Pontibacter mucosus]
MLSDIPWSQFFLVAAAALLLYYLAIALLFYRQNIKRLLTRTYLRTGLPAPRQSPPQASMMGAASAEAVPPLFTAGDLQVAPAAGAGQQDYPPEAAAILEEVASLLESAAEERMDKAEFLSLLRLLDERHMPTEAGSQAVQRFLLEQGAGKLSFPLTAADLTERG